MHMLLNEFHAIILAWLCVLSDRPPVLWWLSPGEAWDALHYAIAANCKTVHLLKIKVQVSSIWAKGRMLDDCVFYLT